MRFLVLHGPNLNRLGTREPEIYGTKTLAQINDELQSTARELGDELRVVQSNHEGALCDAIHQAADDHFDGIILNPAGYGHTSVTLRDAILSVSLPVVEVHLSNPASRESFRRISMVSDVVLGTIAGFGSMSYNLALIALHNKFSLK